MARRDKKVTTGNTTAGDRVTTAPSGGDMWQNSLTRGQVKGFRQAKDVNEDPAFKDLRGSGSKVDNAYEPFKNWSRGKATEQP